MSIQDLGQPLNDAFALAGGQGRLYERGMTISGPAGDAEVRFAFPRIARPKIATATPAAFEQALWFDLGSTPELAAFIQDALGDRISLVAVGQSTVRVPLIAGQAARQPDGYSISLTGGALADRQLYDIAFRSDGDQWTVVAPHAVYGRQSWTDFGIAHITDMHVARRIDRFRDLLRKAGREEAAKNLYNWNDRFRGFVRYANYLHSTGVLDVILTTGDNYDYQFEDTDDRDGGGNAAFLRDLILGKAPGPDFLDVEELRVPIFMVPGNHDYRVSPYKLCFDLHVSTDVQTAMGVFGHIGGIVMSSKDLERVTNYNSYRLGEADAIVLTNRLDNLPSNEAPNIESVTAGRMVEIDEKNRPYRQCLGDPGYYVIELGDHRIVMIDSAHDVGVVTEQLAALLVLSKLRHTEDQDAFVGGSPNCKGVPKEALDEVSHLLSGPQAPKGLFIVGLHAPLFNPPHDGYGYFLRETQRAVQGEQVCAFLAKRGTLPSGQDKLIEEVESDHATWFEPKHAGSVRDHRGPRYVKRENTDDDFHSGVSRGEAEQLMRYLAGLDGSKRAADLVLAGHTHFSNEYRVGIDRASGDLAYYMDFYTQNPTNYYPTNFMRSWAQIDASTAPVPTVVPRQDRQGTFIEVTPDAQPDANPWEMPSAAMKKYMLQVPPYANPLNSAADPSAWWAEHRPLVLQTGALGPLKQLEYFSGFRVITVKNNIIDKIHHVSIARLEDNKFRLGWEQAIEPEAGRRGYHYVERSRPLKAPHAVGVPSGIAFPAGASNVVYRDADGRLHELWRKGDDAGTSDLTTLASNAMLSAGDATSYIDSVDEQEVALYRGTDGHVYSVYWSTGEVKRDALSVTANAPRAAGKPVGYVGKDGFRHVIYRADDGHLHELWWTGGSPPSSNDLTTPVGAPKAAGDPAAYIKPTDGENNVFYRAGDSHIYRLFWPTAGARPEDLSGVAGAPDAAGDPVAYYVSHDDSNHVVYRGADGHLHELSWQGNNPVGRGDLTAVTKDAPAAADGPSGDPVAYYSASNRTHYVIYLGKDGHLNKLTWVGTARPTWIDLTAHAAAPVAADKPTAFIEEPNTHHVMYRGKDNQIHEIRWSHFAHDIPDVGGNVLEEAVQPIDPATVRWHRGAMTRRQR